MANAQDDLKDLQMKMNSITDESLESTRRMRALAEESREVGVKTLVMLDHQGEQLNNIERGIDQMNEDMYTAEKNLESMEKCCGLCILPWKRSKALKASTKYDKIQVKEGKQGTEPATNVQKNSSATKETQSATVVSIQRITNDAREDEMENNLTEVSAIVQNLHTMAVDMNNEITKQNKQIPTLISKSDNLDGRVTDATRRTNVLLK